MKEFLNFYYIVDRIEMIEMIYCILSSDKYFLRYLALNLAFIKSWPGEKILVWSKACDVKSGTEVIVLVSN